MKNSTSDICTNVNAELTTKSRPKSREKTTVLSGLKQLAHRKHTGLMCSRLRPNSNAMFLWAASHDISFTKWVCHDVCLHCLSNDVSINLSSLPVGCNSHAVMVFVFTVRAFSPHNFPSDTQSFYYNCSNPFIAH